MEKLSMYLFSLNFKDIYKKKAVFVLLTFILLTNTPIGFSQTKFYQKDKKKVTVIGEKTTLTFSTTNHMEKPINPESFVTGAAIASLIPSLIDLGFKISTDAIEKNLKKFTNSFTARNVYPHSAYYISGFSLERKIRIRKSETETDALKMNFIPLKVDENTFVFALDFLSVTYSGAKSKKGYNQNDYAVEIKVTYYDGKEKVEQTSAPISIQLKDISSKNYSDKGKTAPEYDYISDKFPLNPSLLISEVSVKVVETNTAKIKAEKIKDLSDKYADDAKGLIKNIVNLYVGDDDKKTEEDGSTEDQTLKK